MSPRAASVGLALLLGLGACGHAPPARGSGVQVELVRPEGGQAALAAWRGQALVVTFFTTWSLPAVAEVPLLNALHAEPGVSVVGVCLDEDASRTLAPFVDTFRVTYPTFLPSASIRAGESPFGPIAAVPTTVILDPRGRPVEAVQGMLDPEATRRLLRRLVAEGRGR